ncbi:hypothetical protein [Bacillus atrophaeus]|uniref:hypothetical protein n=1 Tax=Bacillus atrophaeus TaxID=1452 RepID=UPI002E1CEBF7|nr:hypothetical protein [Bacillus atrophaeus]
MGGTNRIFDVIHHMDIQENKIFAKDGMGGDDLKRFLHGLVYDILTKENRRYYKFMSDSVEINTLALRLFAENELAEEKNEDILKDTCETIAHRALEKHVIAQEKNHMTEIQTGNLIQSLLEYDSDIYFLITKVEQEDFLDAYNLENQKGIPFNKKTRNLKSCLIKYEEGAISEIIVTDSNNSIAAYWYREFLELKELNDDEANTKKAFNLLLRKIKTYVEKKSEPDYNRIHNNLLGYFQTQENFTSDGVIDYVLGDYKPENPDKVDVESLKGKLKKVMKEDKFDTNFKIESKVIKNRMKKTIPISEKVELRIKGFVEDYKDEIYSDKDAAGERIIVLKVQNNETYNKAYRLFKYRE